VNTEKDGPQEELRVIVADPLLPEGFDILREASGITVEDHTQDGPDELVRALVGAAGLIVRSRTKVDADLIRAGSSLQVIGRAGVGVDNIDIDEATRHGIVVLNAPAANTYSTVELAFALLLGSVRRIPEADASIRAGEWKRKELRGTQLAGKTMGIVGVGRVGGEMVRRAQSFGMRVLAHDPYVTEERRNELALDMKPLEELLRAAQIVTIHVPLADENRGLIGRSEIALMPAGSILINAARGGLVDEEALAEALVSGHLSAAGIDVFETEPLPDGSPLRKAPNLVMTPHIGAATVEAQREVSRQIAVSIRDALLLNDYQTALNRDP
jgi:D-3-phosphoglycerate dehydrogenase